MEHRLVFIFFIQIYLIEVCVSNPKDLHSKELAPHSKNNEMNVIKDYYNDFDEILTKNDRFARHAVAITENAIDHLVREINKKYSKSGRKQKLLSALRKKYQKKLNKRKKSKKHAKKM